MTCRTLEQQLITFMKAYPRTNLNWEGDEIRYFFTWFSNAKKQAKEANELIDKLKLDLVAIHYGRCSFFTVVSNETSDL